jgi:hypothetical protein
MSHFIKAILSLSFTALSFTNVYAESMSLDGTSGIHQFRVRHPVTERVCVPVWDDVEERWGAECETNQVGELMGSLEIEVVSLLEASLNYPVKININYTSIESGPQKRTIDFYPQLSYAGFRNEEEQITHQELFVLRDLRSIDFSSLNKKLKLIIVPKNIFAQKQMIASFRALRDTHSATRISLNAQLNLQSADQLFRTRFQWLVIGDKHSLAPCFDEKCPYGKSGPAQFRSTSEENIESIFHTIETTNIRSNCDNRDLVEWKQCNRREDRKEAAFGADLRRSPLKIRARFQTHINSEDFDSVLGNLNANLIEESYELQVR